MNSRDDKQNGCWVVTAGWAMAIMLGFEICLPSSEPATSDQTPPTRLPNAEGTSREYATLQDKIDRIKPYLIESMRKQDFEQLEYVILYRSAYPVGSTARDIRLLAVVPRDSLATWIPPDVGAIADYEPTWLATVPAGIAAAGIDEWYVTPGLVVGIDRDAAIVAYRNWFP